MVQPGRATTATLSALAAAPCGAPVAVVEYGDAAGEEPTLVAGLRF